MSIATVNVIVPSSGDGPVANVSALVGEKTIVLGGTYVGTYTLLGSQDGGATFVPVVTFDTDGSDSIELTVAAAFQLVRLRARTGTVRTSPLTCSVSGLSTPGANQFATLATFPPGSGGISVVVDTHAIFPPTGLEADIAIVCSGGFIGTIVVEGSQDASNWNVVVFFQAGPSPRPLVSLPPLLEFAPLITQDKVRYLQVSVVGQVSTTSVVTIGGRSTVAAPPSSTTLSQAYVNGAIPGDQELVLLDARGGGVVIVGTHVGFTGASSLKIVSAAGSVSFPRLGGMDVDGDTVFGDSVAVGVAAPTARLELGGGTVVANTASLKIGVGTLLAVTESGAVESDGAHLYWTNAGGSRLQLDGGGGGGTLSNAYDAGTVAVDQTLALEDAAGGGVVVNGMSATFTGTSSLKVVSAAGSVSFLRIGGLETDGDAVFNDSMAIGVAVPTARLELAPGTAVAGTASLKINAGVLLAVTETGSVESDGAHLYWTNGGGARLQLDGGNSTLSGAYTTGTSPADQTMALVDPKGGITIDGSGVGFTATNALVVNTSAGGNFVLSRASTNLTLMGAAYAGLTAGAELIDANFNLSATKQWSTGDLAVQRDFLIQARTYDFVGASIVTTGATLVVSGPPAAGVNATITNPLAFWVQAGIAEFADNVGVGILQPTARLHLAAVTTTSGTASLKIVAGILMTVPEQGAIESDGTNLWWTDSGGLRKQLDGGGGGGGTLATDYASGTISADQTMSLFDARGGGIIVDGSNGAFTGVNALEVRGTSSSLVAFTRLGGGLSITQGVVTGGVPNALVVTGAAHTAITASTEDIGAYFDFSATKQWDTGLLSVQREVVFQAPTYTSLGASTILDAATIAITGSPMAGINTTITNPLALWVQSGDTILSGRLGVGYPGIGGGAGLPDAGNNNVFAVRITRENPIGPNQGFGSFCIQPTTSAFVLNAGISPVDNSFWMQSSAYNSTACAPIVLNPYGGGVSISVSPGTSQGHSSLKVSTGPEGETHTGASTPVWDMLSFDQCSFQQLGTQAVTTSLTAVRITNLSVGTLLPLWTITDLNTLSISPIYSFAPAVATRTWVASFLGNVRITGGLRLNAKIVTTTTYSVLDPGNYTADCILQVTNATATTIMLPPISLTLSGWIIVVVDSRYNAAAANITLVPNGTEKINNVAGSYVMNVSGMSRLLVANSATGNWEFIG